MMLKNHSQPGWTFSPSIFNEQALIILFFNESIESEDATFFHHLENSLHVQIFVIYIPFAMDTKIYKNGAFYETNVKLKTKLQF